MTQDEEHKLFTYWVEATGEGTIAALRQRFFEALMVRYRDPDRCYHNTSHIIAMLDMACRFKNCLTHYHEVQLAIFYHDAIYVAGNADNEEQSARLAEDHLSALHIPPDKIFLIVHFIKSTASHTITSGSAESDLEYFIDFDLSILGASDSEYMAYAKAIRQEYMQYPNALYNEGRKKALLLFLSRESIFLSQEFKASHEARARANLLHELRSL